MEIKIRLLLVMFTIVLYLVSTGYCETSKTDSRLTDPFCKHCHQSKVTHENVTDKDCHKCHMSYDSNHLKNHIKSPANAGNEKFCPQCHNKYK